MKLKNLMYATMFACAFASCSNDDVPEIQTPGTDGDATLSLKVSAPLSTRSITGTDGEDTKITTLTTYVFDEKSQLLEAVGTEKVTDTESKTEKLKAGTKKVIVLANITPVDAVTAIGTVTYANFIAMSSANLAKETNGNLSMNSQVFDVVLKAGVINYLGYDAAPTTGGNIVLNVAGGVVAAAPVKLYRNVAKVVLSKIEVKDTNKERYPNAKLTVENVYILNGRSTTNIVGADAKAWGTTMSSASAYENGMSGSDYATWVGTFETIGKTALFSYLTGNYATDAFLTYVGAPVGMVLAYGQSATAVDKFYVYENTLGQTNAKGTDANTLLVVKGKFSYDGIAVVESRYYTVAIGHAGTEAVTLPADFGMTNATYADASGRDAVAGLTGALRNLQYNISLTVTGPGYTTPVGPKPEDDTFLQTQVKVVPFGVVEQGSEIE